MAEPEATPDRPNRDGANPEPQALRLGAHMSIAGGLQRAVERIRAVQGTALQVFTRNQRQWRIPPLEPAHVATFRAAWLEGGAELPVVAHDSYLVNLAGPPGQTTERSLEAFGAELRRCEALGIPALVTHPGAHKGAGVELGIERYVQRLDEALRRSETTTVRVLLETTAGQGTVLGSRFEELALIIRASEHGQRLGVCLDTCHVFAAGYDLASEGGYAAMREELEATVGLERVGALHLNDSLGELGAHRDRHTHIGDGALGLSAFERVVSDPAFVGLPMILETPKGPDLDDDRRNLARLRALADSGVRSEGPPVTTAPAEPGPS